jgi:hypothetical protein
MNRIPIGENTSRKLAQSVRPGDGISSAIGMLRQLRQPSAVRGVF